MSQRLGQSTGHPVRLWLAGCIFILAISCPNPRAILAQSWTAKADMPSAREKVATCAIGRLVYVIGGATGADQQGLSTNERYDAETDAWTTRQPMPTARRELTAAAVDGKCYVIGGSRGRASTPLSVLEIYDPTTDQWSTGADMPTARFYPASVVIDDLIYVVGGAAGADAIYGALEAYDPASDTWSTLAPMPTPRAVSAAAALDGRLYVFGGTNSPFAQRFAVAEVYDPDSDQWSTVANMPRAIAAMRAQSTGSRIIVMGGSEANQAGVRDVNAYDPKGDSWTAMTPLPTSLALHGSAIIDDELMVFGGALSTQPPHPALNGVLALAVPGIERSVPINTGMADAWYDPDKAGQGFFITIFPEIRVVFLAWFTYDTERPQASVPAILGEPGHRWLTAQGGYANGVAVLDVVMTSGGVFDRPEPEVSNDAEYGTITIEWPDCAHAMLEYDLTVPDLQGSIDLQRVAPDRVTLCEALADS